MSSTTLSSRHQSKEHKRGQGGQIQINHFIFRNDPGELQDADYNIFIAKHNKVVMKL